LEELRKRGIFVFLGEGFYLKIVFWGRVFEEFLAIFGEFFSNFGGVFKTFLGFYEYKTTSSHF